MRNQESKTRIPQSVAETGTDKMLVVDDEEIIHLTIDRIFRDSGIQIEYALSATDALGRIQEGFGVVVTDIRMPGMDGIELLRRIKRIDTSVEVIVMTGFASLETTMKAKRYGALTYITKPLEDSDILVEGVRKALARRADTRTNEQLYDAVVKGQIDSLVVNGESKIIPFFREGSAQITEHLFGTLYDGMVFVDLDGRITFSNIKFPQTLGYSDLELIGKPFSDYVHKEDLTTFETFIATLQNEGSGLLSEIRLKSSAGRSIPAALNAVCLRNAEGKIEDILITIGDLSELRTVQARIERLARLVDQARFEAIIVYDRGGTITDCNHAAASMLMMTKGMVLGTLVHDLFRDLEKSYFEVRRPATSDEPVVEAVAVRADGSVVPVEISISTLEEEEEEEEEDQKGGGMVFVRDITERKQAEEALRERDEQLRQAQKMEAIGVLAGGVAHEFNNLLQSISGYTKFARKGLPEDNQRYQDLGVVLKAAEKATNLTRQLLSFGRRQAMMPTHIDPNELVADLLTMVRPMIGEDIEFVPKLAEGVGTVHVDSTSMHQMLMNLCVNARDAMPDGGELTIKTENVVLTDSDCAGEVDVKPGRYALLTVSDTGCGISPDVRDHIFEPFVTTKEVGKGTGLGLAMVYGVVQQHQGMIHVDSEPGEGTTFKIYFPTSDTSAETSLGDTPVSMLVESETILVAEDDSMVREFVTRVLEDAGYSVLTATDGEEALRVFEANSGIVALALLDVLMPKRTGRMVYQAIKSLKPEIKVLFCSGYDPDTHFSGFIEDDGLQLIQKPIDADVLLQNVREILDRKAPCQLLQTTR